MSYIVVEDLKGIIRCGTVVSEANVGRLKDGGVCMLPYDSDGDVLDGAVNGFFKREYGTKGNPLTIGPRAVARAVIVTTPHKKRIHWAARIAPTCSAENKKSKSSNQSFLGSVRLANDPVSSGLSGAMSAVHNTTFGFKTLGAIDANGGWNITGDATINANEGIHGFMLYGNGPGLSVLWMAISLTKD